MLPTTQEPVQVVLFFTNLGLKYVKQGFNVSAQEGDDKRRRKGKSRLSPDRQCSWFDISDSFIFSEH